jgi:DNA repair exonuclease SbcCD ATPase subunit
MASDMTAGARGLGIVCVLVGILFLGGFAFLVRSGTNDLASTDTDGKSLQSFVTDQSKDLMDFQSGIDRANTELLKMPEREHAIQEVTRIRQENKNLEQKISKMLEGCDKTNQAISSTQAEFIKYKESYVTMVRGKAKGEMMDKLVTLSGETYNHVSIREVVADGVQIRHDVGMKKILFKDLPKEMQARLMFVP